MDQHAGACAPRYAQARVGLPQWRAPTYYYLVNDIWAFAAGKKGTLVRERAPIARSPNRGGYHEDESLCVGRFVGPDLFARHAPAARFDSSCRAVLPTNMFCSGQPLRLLGWRRWGSDLGSTGKRDRWRGTCGADHTSQAPREAQTILRGILESRRRARCSGRGIPCWRSSVRGLLRGLCHGTTFAKHLLLMLGR
jgi:hypothetical protein